MNIRIKLSLLFICFVSHMAYGDHLLFIDNQTQWQWQFEGDADDGKWQGTLLPYMRATVKEGKGCLKQAVAIQVSPWKAKIDFFKSQRHLNKCGDTLYGINDIGGGKYKVEKYKDAKYDIPLDNVCIINNTFHQLALYLNSGSDWSTKGNISLTGECVTKYWKDCLASMDPYSRGIIIFDNIGANIQVKYHNTFVTIPLGQDKLHPSYCVIEEKKDDPSTLIVKSFNYREWVNYWLKNMAEKVKELTPEKRKKLAECVRILDQKLSPSEIDQLKKDIQDTQQRIANWQKKKHKFGLSDEEQKTFKKQQDILKEQQDKLQAAQTGAQKYRDQQCQELTGRPYPQ